MVTDKDSASNHNFSFAIPSFYNYSLSESLKTFLNDQGFLKELAKDDLKLYPFILKPNGILISTQDFIFKPISENLLENSGAFFAQFPIFVKDPAGLNDTAIVKV